MRMSLVLWICPLVVAFAESPLPAQEPAVKVVRLKFDPSGGNLPITVRLEGIEVVFKKTPAFVGPVVTGVLEFDPDHREANMAFAWERTKNVLHLDTNRNLDLTDDPGGTVRSQGPDPREFFCDWRPIAVQQGQRTIEHVLFVAITPASRDEFTTLASISSRWLGDAAWDGFPWSFVLYDLCDGNIGPEDSLSAHDETMMQSWRCESLPRILTWNDKTYTVSYAFAPTPRNPDLLLTFTENRPQLTTLRIETAQFQDLPEELKRNRLDAMQVYGEPGKWEHLIRQLTLEQSGEDGGFAIFSDPGDAIQLPPGDYVRQVVNLRTGRGHGNDGLTARRAQTLTVATDGSSTLKIGPPLTDGVTAERDGNRLVATYHLYGQGGEDYGGSAHFPTFDVRMGSLKIGSGHFARWT